MLYILYVQSDLIDFLFDSLKERDDLVLIKLNPRTDLLSRIIKHSALKFGLIPFLPKNFLFRNKNIPSHFNPEDKILLFDHLFDSTIKWIMKRISIESIRLFYWNTIENNSPSKYIPPSQSYTFDFKDSIKYNLNLVPQVYRKQSEILQLPKYDFFFIGANKDRFEGLQKLVLELLKYGFSVKCIIVDFNNVLLPVDYLDIRNHGIPYHEVIEYINNSKAIIDFTKQGQTGYTLRVLEGIFLKKKVITNNLNIKNSKIYNINNFFIYEGGNIDALREFMIRPYLPYNSEDLAPHEINTWINRFL